MKQSIYKKVTTAVVVFSILVLMSGCTSRSFDKKSIYEDTTKIAEQGDSFSFVGATSEVKDLSIDLKFKRFAGKQSIYLIDASETDTVSLSIEPTLEKGKLKICLRDSDSNVTTLWENGMEETIAFTIPKGESTILMVGEDAKGAFIFKFADQGKSAVKVAPFME